MGIGVMDSGNKKQDKSKTKRLQIFKIGKELRHHNTTFRYIMGGMYDRINGTILWQHYN
jgi:hypothetical protein